MNLEASDSESDHSEDSEEEMGRVGEGSKQFRQGKGMSRTSTWRGREDSNRKQSKLRQMMCVLFPFGLNRLC